MQSQNYSPTHSGGAGDHSTLIANAFFIRKKNIGFNWARVKWIFLFHSIQKPCFSTHNASSPLFRGDH